MAAYVSIVCLMFYYTLKNSRLETIEFFKVMLIAGIIASIIQIITYIKFNIRSLLFWLVVAGIFILYFINNGNSRVIITCLATLSCANISFDTMMPLLFYTKLLSFLIIAPIGHYGANSFALHLGALILLYLCMTKLNVRGVRYIVLFTVYILGYFYTKTGAFAVVIGFAVISVLLVRVGFVKNMLRSKIVVIIFPLCLFLNYFFAAGVGEQKIPFIGNYLAGWINRLYIYIIQVLDVYMSRRLSLTKTSFVAFGVSLWGGNIDVASLHLDSYTYFYLDSGLMGLLQGWGIIMTVIIMFMTILFMKYAVETENYAFIILGIATALYGINEDMLLSLGTNMLFWMIGGVCNYFFKRRGVRHENT
jgi:hypothetical protein